MKVRIRRESNQDVVLGFNARGVPLVPSAPPTYTGDVIYRVEYRRVDFDLLLDGHIEYFLRSLFGWQIWYAHSGGASSYTSYADALRGARQCVAWMQLHKRDPRAETYDVAIGDQLELFE